MIAKTVERMEQLIDNVRVMMMAETMPSRVQKFALKELVNRAIAKAKSQTLDPAVRVGVRHPQEPLVVVADPLIEHALAEIARECMRQERADIARLNIDVKPDYEINTVRIEFISFSPVQDPTIKESLLEWHSPGALPGESLSLPLAKTIIEKSGGEVTVQDRIPGRPEEGIKFVVTLPVEQGEIENHHGGESSFVSGIT